MVVLLQVACEAQGGFDIAGLSAFVATGQQDDQLLATLDEIHPVSGPVIDPQFRDAFGNWLDVARITRREPFDPDQNARPCADVPQAVKPFDETSVLRISIMGRL